MSGVPVAEFAQLRKTAPVWWNEQPAGSSVFDDGGYWVVSKHQHIKEISRDSDVWSANAKGVLMRFPEGTTTEQLELTKALLINHDPPEHTRLRKLVSRLFTPRAVAALEEKLALTAHDIVAAAAVMGYAYNMAEERRRCPADDIVTRLIEADIDGESLGETEFAFFVILLAVAGNETTRNAMTHGINAFAENPGQWKLFKRDRPATAVDEIIRWATPVHCFQRTANIDTELGGVAIRRGQRVGLFYSSANYDEEVFDRPFEFNVLRDPNPHLAFGGQGTHYCIGANLARMEIRLIFDQLANHLPDITRLAEPQRLRSGWINGIKDLQVSYH